MVIEVLKSGVVRVAFGGLVVQCRGADLGPAKNERDDDEDERPKAKARKAARGARGGMAKVDLHGLGVDEALQVVQRAVNEALMAGADGIHVIHGLGTGKLKAGVHRYLASLTVVKRFRLLEGNAGTTVAYF